MDSIRIEFPLKNSTKLDEGLAVQAMMKGLQKLVEFGAIKGKLDDILLSYEFTDKLGYAIAVLKKDSLVDASKLNSIGASYVWKVDDFNKDELTVTNKSFSVATIQERMRLSGLNPKMKFRITIQDYKKYWRSQKSKMMKNPDLAKRLKNMFLVDLTGIFTEILPFIEEGKQLGSLTGLNMVTEGMINISRDLSLAYKKALQQSKTGQLSKTVFTGLQTKYKDFVNQLIPQVFPDIEQVLGGEQKSFSSVDKEGIVTITTTNPKRIYEILDYIDKSTKGGHCAKIVVDQGQEGEKTFEFDGDGSDRISSIDMKETTVTKGYSYTSEGRIRLFS